MANVGLYRSNRSNMIAGVMGGIAERFGWNANWWCFKKYADIK
jgi:phage shock protein PspC (stress-responsive transcriptional regulator)